MQKNRRNIPDAPIYDLRPDFQFPDGPYVSCAEPSPHVPDDNPSRPPKPPKKHRRRFGRIFRGYLMIVGALTTLLLLTWGIVEIFVAIQEGINRVP